MLISQIHKRINFNFDKQKLVFETCRELFSFAKIDDGTKELLNSLRKNPKIDYKKILDLGCGYGAIGTYLKKKFPNSEVLCTDRDSLAVEFTKHNAELNHVEIEARASLDFAEIKEKFSLIITNFPAKLEKEGLEYFIAKSSEHLEKDGSMVLVVVKELENSMNEILKNEKISVSFKEKGKNYSVYHLNFSEKLNIPEFSYLDNEITLEIENNIYPLITSGALQEFDNPHYVAELLTNKISKENYNSYKKIMVLNPGQGFVSVASAHACSRDKIILASRDLLQLKLSSENLSLNAVNYFEIINSDFPQNKGDLLIWGLRDEDTKEVLEKLKVYRNNFKKIILSGRLPIVKRVLQNLKLDLRMEIKGKYCVVEI